MFFERLDEYHKFVEFCLLRDFFENAEQPKLVEIAHKEIKLFPLTFAGKGQSDPLY